MYYGQANVWPYVLAMLFGVLIFIVPELVSYVIATFLIIFGLSGILQRWGR